MTPTVAADAPYLLVRGAATSISVALHQDGGALVVSTATASLYDHTSTLVDTYTATETRSPTVTIPSTDVPSTVDYSEGWRVEWDLDGRVVQLPAYVVRQAWTPSITDADLWRRAPALDPSDPAPISSRLDYEAERSEASRQVQDRMVQAGRRPWMVFEPTALREPLMLLTLALIFEGLGHRDPQHFETADRYRSQYETAWGRLRFTYDQDQDGERDSSERSSAAGSVWLC